MPYSPASCATTSVMDIMCLSLETTQASIFGPGKFPFLWFTAGTSYRRQRRHMQSCHTTRTSTPSSTTRDLGAGLCNGETPKPVVSRMKPPACVCLTDDVYTSYFLVAGKLKCPRFARVRSVDDVVLCGNGLCAWCSDNKPETTIASRGKQQKMSICMYVSTVTS